MGAAGGMALLCIGIAAIVTAKRYSILEEEQVHNPNPIASASPDLNPNLTLLCLSLTLTKEQVPKSTLHTLSNPRPSRTQSKKSPSEWHMALRH